MTANKFEAFETVTIQRSGINFADYNPRKISDSAQKKLKRFMKQFGLLGALIWNRRTGNLVSGHQRLTQLDELNRYPEKVGDYELTVSAVDLSEEDEVKANVFLNNTSAMGEWDIDILTQLKDLFPEVDYVKDFGFDKEELSIFMPEQDLSFGEFAAQQEPGIPLEPVSEEEREKMREIKKKARDKATEDNADGAGYKHADADYTLQIVFRTADDKRSFMSMLEMSAKKKWCTVDQLIEGLGL